jgi:hypothetical protein
MRKPYCFSSRAFRSLALLCCTLVLSISAFSEKAKIIEVRYPSFVASDEIYSKRTAYYAALLTLALSHAEGEYALSPIKVPTITGSRNSRYLNRGLYDINWMHTTRNREKELIPIRIPLVKGLIGWRLFFIHPDQASRFEHVKSTETLKPLIAGLGHDWPDTQILNANGFNTSTTNGRDSLFKMLSHQRIDYYSRSIMEIWEEREIFNTRGAVIDKNVALHYPTAIYFFVPKRSTDFAALVEQGLEASIADGSFDALFWQYFEEDIVRAQLATRTIIEIPNPLLSEETPLDREALWFRPNAASLK